MTTVRTTKAKQRPGDRIFSASTTIAGSIILAALAAVAIFLLAESIPAVTAGEGDLPRGATNFWNYVAPLAFGTLWAAVIALIIAFPLAIGSRSSSRTTLRGESLRDSATSSICS